MKLTSKNLPTITKSDKLLKSFVGEVYDSRLRDDLRVKRLQDFEEDYTIDNYDKGVETLNESITK